MARSGPVSSIDSARFAVPAAAVLGTFLLLVLYAWASVGLGRDVNVLRFSSGIFDMDVERVVEDWTTDHVNLQYGSHPLYKLVLTPIGSALRGDGDARRALDVIRWMIAIAMALNALLVGWLCMQLAGGALVPGVLAGLLCGVSFSSVLLGAIPETASFSGLCTLAPLLFLGARFGRPISRAEPVAWGVLGVLCIALTITQIVPWLISLGCRLAFELRARRHTTDPDNRAASIRRCAAAVAIFGLLTFGAAQLQVRLYPKAAGYYDWSLLSRHQVWFRVDDIRSAPLAHTGRLAAHFLVYDFAAPLPVYSDYLMKLYGPRFYWSLSIEEATARTWRGAQIPLLGGIALLIGSGLAGVLRLDRRFVAPILCLAAQFGLHFIFGREYILYSANWHGLLVAAVVASAWRAAPPVRRALPWLAVPLAAGLLANSLVVLDRVYYEMKIGMSRESRDETGRPLGRDR